VGRRKANCLIQFLRWNAQYLIRLCSLSVYLRKSNFYNNIQFLIFALEQIPSLNHIRITYIAKFDRNDDNWGPLMACIFSKRLNIQKCSFISDMSDYNMINSTWSINPSLKYLQIGDMSLNNLFSLLSFTPQLHFLRAKIDAPHLASYKNVVLTHLEKVDLDICVSRFAQLQTFKEVARNLNSLRLKGTFDSKDDNFFKENLWHELLNNVKYFHVNLRSYGFNDLQKTTLRNHIIHFNGKSWFSYTETERVLTLFIKYKSTVM